MWKQLKSDTCHWLVNIVYMGLFFGLSYINIEISPKASWWVFFGGFAFCINGGELFKKIESILNDKLVDSTLEKIREEKGEENAKT